jgi:K+-sensing histidine kinase KdpD
VFAFPFDYTRPASTAMVTAESKHMNRSDILVPLNPEKDSMDGLKFAANLARDMSLRATLLYVVELNILPPDRRIYDEVCFEYERKLQNLAGCFAGNDFLLCARVGKPHEQILAEARDSGVDLIVMGAPGNHRWRWPFHATTVERVVRAAPCMTLVMSEPWSTPAARDYLSESFFARRAAGAGATVPA